MGTILHIVLYTHIRARALYYFSSLSTFCIFPHTTIDSNPSGINQRASLSLDEAERRSPSCVLSLVESANISDTRLGFSLANGPHSLELETLELDGGAVSDQVVH